MWIVVRVVGTKVQRSQRKCARLSGRGTVCTWCIDVKIILGTKQTINQLHGQDFLTVVSKLRLVAGERREMAGDGARARCARAHWRSQHHVRSICGRTRDARLDRVAGGISERVLAA